MLSCYFRFSHLETARRRLSLFAARRLKNARNVGFTRQFTTVESYEMLKRLILGDKGGVYPSLFVPPFYRPRTFIILQVFSSLYPSNSLSLSSSIAFSLYRPIENKRGFISYADWSRTLRAWHDTLFFIRSHAVPDYGNSIGMCFPISVSKTKNKSRFLCFFSSPRREHYTYMYILAPSLSLSTFGKYACCCMYIYTFRGEG